MKTQRMRRGASNTSTLTIVIIVVVVVGLIVVGCFGAVLAGLLLPALTQARESALFLRSGAQLRQIDITYQIWRRDAEPDAEFSFDVLVNGNYATPDLFMSPIGPVPDGGEDYWLLHPRPDVGDPDAADTVIGYDRAQYATTRRVAVLFGDGRAEVIDIADFERLLRAPPNAEVDFNLPPRAQP